MPRYYYDGARDTADSKRKISVKWLKDNGYLEKDNYKYGGMVWSSNDEETGRMNFSTCLDERGDSISFNYRVRQQGEDDWKDMDYKFNLLKTPCYFGGYRYWFQCGLYKQNVYCGRRVGVLYSVGNYFGCRHCANLSYDSCNESKRFKGYPFSILTKETKAEKLYDEIKREFYNGKPTRKYKRYLKLRGFTDEELLKAELDLQKEL